LSKRRLEIVKTLDYIRKLKYTAYVCVTSIVLCVCIVSGYLSFLKPVLPVLFLVVFISGIGGYILQIQVCPYCKNRFFEKGEGAKFQYNTFTHSCLNCGIRYDCSNIDEYTQESAGRQKHHRK